jgi:hypothetical protein
LVEVHARHRLDHVDPDLRAEIADLVGKRDQRREQRVGGVLDHLGGARVGAHLVDLEKAA